MLVSATGQFISILLRMFYLTHVPGDCLISSGDDGVIRFWKMSLAGEWLEYAETDMSY